MDDIETIEQLQAESRERNEEFCVETQDALEARGPQFNAFRSYPDDTIPF